jgi:DNA-binding transcriptional regulator YiaG
LANAPPSPLAKRTKKGIAMETTKIKLERLQLGISQSKMAERLGVGLRCYQYYESGERQIPKPVIMLHQALKRNAILERNEKLAKERG